MNKKNPYYILGIGMDAGLKQIREAYENLIKMYSKNFASEEKIAELEEAFLALSTPERRLIHDIKEEQFLDAVAGLEFILGRNVLGFG